MHISENSLDDLLLKTFQKLLKSKSSVSATRGPSKEIIGVLLELKNPRSRLSRTEMKGTIFSCLGEFLWYLSKSNKLPFIQYYLARYDENSDDNETIHGAYGPRLFNMDDKTNQVENILNLLSERETSRRAVIQLFDHKDLSGNHKDIPCTCNMQFFIRKGMLHMYVSMRSNDAYLGLPHDIFAFTMIQEIIARSLNVELGTYKHSVGSLHIYSEHIEKAELFIDEGYQSSFSMPSMPVGDPWKSIENLLVHESNIRNDKSDSCYQDDNYWNDLKILLQIFKLSKLDCKDSIAEIDKLKEEISSEIYKIYIDKKKNNMKAVSYQHSLAFKEGEKK